MTLEAWIEEDARGLYRWEGGRGWDEDVVFEPHTPITINPIPDASYGENAIFLPVYGEFIEYVTEDIAKVYIPPPSDESDPSCWFRGEAGTYLIHEGYLTPQ